MNQETLQAIETLAAKLGVVTEHLWVVLIKQAMVDAVFHAVWFAVFLGEFTALAIYYKKCGDVEKWDWNDEDMWACTSFFGVMGLIVIILIAANLHGMVTGFLNPEYYALMEILSAVKE